MGSSGGSYSWVCNDSPPILGALCMVASGAGVRAGARGGRALVFICPEDCMISI